MPDLMTLVGGCKGDTDLYTEIMKENLDQRVLVINDEITESIVEDFVLYILKWNREDKDLPVDKRTPITIFLNSPGGSVFDGEILVEIIQNSITPIRAVCIGMAASMAFRIYICCPERIAFKTSVLLMHDGEVSISNSTSKAKDTMKFFDRMEEKTKEFVLKYTTMDEAFYDSKYDSEYYMYAAEDGKKYGCVDKIIGEDIDLDYIL